MRDVFIKKLLDLALNDSRIMLVTGDLGYGVLDDFRDKCPRQYLNVGVAEQNMTGIATGLALEGRIVFTYSIANFATMRCIEHIRNDVCYHKVNVNVVCIGAGFSYGSLGITHHAVEDISIMRSLPDMTVCSPGDNWEVEETTKALCQTEGAGYLRLDKAQINLEPKEGEVYALGQARQLKDGEDLTLISTGGILEEVLAAAERLSQSGIYARVLSIHTIKPIDEEAIKKAAVETGGIITVEEHSVLGGLGGAVSETLLESDTRPSFFYRIGLREGFSSVVGDQKYLRTRYQLDEEAIIQKATELVNSK